nr:hypothetical protein [uncultured Duganella sp.]
MSTPMRSGHWTGHFLYAVLSALFAIVLAACGGGGGGAGGGCTTIDPSRPSNLPGCGTTPTTPTTPTAPTRPLVIGAVLVDASGAVVAGVSTERPATLVATVKTDANVAVANLLVTFSSTDSGATTVPASGTALTDAAGVARITLRAGTVAGAYRASARATSADVAYTGSVNYTSTVTPPPSASLALQLNDAAGAPATSVGPGQPGTLRATVRDSAGAAVANAVVAFTTSDATATLLPSPTALTNAQGVAQVTLPAGTLVGGFTASATSSVAGAAVAGSTSYAVTAAAPPVSAPRPTLTVSLSNAAGAAATGIAPDQPGTLTARVRDAAGAAVANALVAFATNDAGGSFTPAGGGVLTDAAGIASIRLNAGTSAGGYSAGATTTVAGVALTGGVNYTVNFPPLTLSAPALSPTTLAAGGTASLAVTVLNGAAPYAPSQSVSFTSPCATNGKARISSPVTTVNGVASTSYTDLGCGGVDVITASFAYNGGNVTSSASLTVQAASAGQLAFVSALPQNIALKGTGGAGRQESATVTFKVLDRSGNPVSGQAVNFSLDTSAGGLTLNPASATTGSGGLVTTSVAAGTVNTPVRVSASLPGTTLSTLSDQLVVSTGVPDQNGFSLSSVIRNIEGGQYNGCPAPFGTLITARLSDHFRNPAPDGTAVSFTAEGGSVDASCLTGLTNTTLTDGTVITQRGTPGECTVRYCAGNPRPADGRVTVLAYALGEESFVDTNGNNLFDNGEGYTDLGEPFRNDRAVTGANANGIDDAWTSGNAVRAGGEPYIDSNGSGAWNQAGNGAYNGVLQSTPNVNTGNANTVHVRQGLVMVLSNSSPNVSLLDQAVNGAPTIGTLALDQCITGQRFFNDARNFRFAIRDDNPTVFAGNARSAHAGDPLWLFDRPGNPLPAGTSITFSTSNGAVLGTTNVTVPNTSAADAAAWTYTVSMISDASQDATTLACSNPTRSGGLTITVATPSGVVTRFTYPVTD